MKIDFFKMAFGRPKLTAERKIRMKITVILNNKLLNFRMQIQADSYKIQINAIVKFVKRFYIYFFTRIGLKQLIFVTDAWRLNSVF